MPSKAGILKRATHELRELIFLTAYLYVIFSVMLFYKDAVLDSAGIAWAPWGLALIKALLVAKFVQLGRALRIDERYHTKPLIWPTLHKAALFLVVVVILMTIEEAVLGLIHGRTVWQSMAGMGGGTIKQAVATMLLVFLIFLPYFGIRSLGEAMGENSLARLFFVERQEFRAVKRSAPKDLVD